MRVVVVGIANQQTSLPVGRFPIEYAPQRYLNGTIRHTVAGVGFNVARALSALGNMVALASPLGEDNPAALIDAEAYRYNLSTHLCRRDLYRTPRSVVLYDDFGRRQVYTDLSDAVDFHFRSEDLEPDLYRADVVVLSDLEMGRPLIQPLRQHRQPFAVDLQDVQGPDSPADEEFLAADYLNMSNGLVAGREREVLLALRDRSHARVLSMTMGADGVLVVGRDMAEPVHVETPEVLAISTAGAGDTYWAVFLHHLLNLQEDPVTAARGACTAAARLVSSLGLTGSSDARRMRGILGPSPEAVTTTASPEVAWNAYTPEW